MKLVGLTNNQTRNQKPETRKPVNPTPKHMSLESNSSKKSNFTFEPHFDLSYLSQPTQYISKFDQFRDSFSLTNLKFDNGFARPQFLFSSAKLLPRNISKLPGYLPMHGKCFSLFSQPFAPILPSKSPIPLSKRKPIHCISCSAYATPCSFVSKPQSSPTPNFLCSFCGSTNKLPSDIISNLREYPQFFRGSVEFSLDPNFYVSFPKNESPTETDTPTEFSTQSPISTPENSDTLLIETTTTTNEDDHLASTSSQDSNLLITNSSTNLKELNNISPRPPIASKTTIQPSITPHSRDHDYVFILDISQEAVRTGMLSVTIKSILDSIENLLRLFPNVYIGIIAYDAHIYQFSFDMNHPDTFGMDTMTIDTSPAQITYPLSLYYSLFVDCLNSIIDIAKSLHIKTCASIEVLDYTLYSILAIQNTSALANISHTFPHKIFFFSSNPIFNQQDWKQRLSDYQSIIVQNAIGIDLFLFSHQSKFSTELLNLSYASGGRTYFYPCFQDLHHSQISLSKTIFQRIVPPSIFDSKLMAKSEANDDLIGYSVFSPSDISIKLHSSQSFQHHPITPSGIYGYQSDKTLNLATCDPDTTLAWTIIPTKTNIKTHPHSKFPPLSKTPPPEISKKPQETNNIQFHQTKANEFVFFQLEIRYRSQSQRFLRIHTIGIPIRDIPTGNMNPNIENSSIPSQSHPIFSCHTFFYPKYLIYHIFLFFSNQISRRLNYITFHSDPYFKLLLSSSECSQHVISPDAIQDSPLLSMFKFIHQQFLIIFKKLKIPFQNPLTTPSLLNHIIELSTSKPDSQDSNIFSFFVEPSVTISEPPEPVSQLPPEPEPIYAHIEHMLEKSNDSIITLLYKLFSFFSLSQMQHFGTLSRVMLHVLHLLPIHPSFMSNFLKLIASSPLDVSFSTLFPTLFGIEPSSNSSETLNLVPFHPPFSHPKPFPHYSLYYLNAGLFSTFFITPPTPTVSGLFNSVFHSLFSLNHFYSLVSKQNSDINTTISNSHIYDISPLISARPGYFANPRVSKLYLLDSESHNLSSNGYRTGFLCLNPQIHCNLSLKIKDIDKFLYWQIGNSFSRNSFVIGDLVSAPILVKLLLRELI